MVMSRPEMELFLLLFCMTIVINSATNITVITKLGNITGKIKPVSVGPTLTVDISTYLGIPFAEAPIGDQRFSKPVPKRRFDGSFLAFNTSAACPQYYPGLDAGVVSEDCLFLNVFSPDIYQNGTKYPVMIWIHGGAFIFGAGFRKTSEKLSAFGKVVVVAINYRLGPFGFLNTGDGSGNYGLWDQHTAIKWVHNNIDRFGGDISKVTIFGESAGAGAVMYQAIYPGNKDLFQRVIAQSGSAGAPWALVKDPSSKAKEFANRFKCPVSPSSAMITCLRAVENTTALSYHSFITFFTGGGADWSPSIDNEFVTQGRVDALKWPLRNTNLQFFSELDLMMGTTGYEGQNFLSPEPNSKNYHVFLNISSTLNDTKIAAINALSLTLSTIYGEELATAILGDVKFQYSNFEDPLDRNIYIKKVIDVISDANFYIPTYTALVNHVLSTSEAKTYQYQFNEPNPLRRKLPWINGAVHTGELNYLFGSVYDSAVSINLDQTVIDAQWKLSSSVMRYWTNFAKTGDPNSPIKPEVEWNEFTEEARKYLYLTSANIENGINLYGRRTAFWLDYLPPILQRAKDILKQTTEAEDCVVLSSSARIISGSMVMVYFLYYLV